MDEKKSYLDKVLNQLLILAYSKDKKIERYVIILTIFGFFLRLLAALNLNVFADDMVHTFQSAGIISAKLLSTHSNPALFFYLTDFSYNILGYTTFASRFFPLITGTMLIPLVYLITLKLFNNKKIGLFAAFFATLSTFLVRNTFGEASLVVLFFSMLGIYLGMLFLETRRNSFIFLSGIAFGLGVLTKYNAPFFILGFLIYSVFYLRLRKEKVFTKRHVKSLAIFLFTILFFTLPPLVFNYLIFKDLGIMDVYFSRVIQTPATQQLYGGLAGQGNSFFGNLFDITSYRLVTLPFLTDLILTLFALIGLFFLINRKRYSKLWFILPILIIPFILQSAGAPLPKHFVFIPFIFSILAGYGLFIISIKLNKRNVLITLIIVITVLMLINLGNGYSTPKNYLEKSSTSQLKAYLGNQVSEGELIVFDSRIYIARSFWLATPNNFLIDSRFVEINRILSTISDEYKTGIPVYFVECAIDDCGWGTIASQPEVNASAEVFFSQVKNVANLDKSIYSNRFDGNEFYKKTGEVEVYRVYKQTIALSPETINKVSTLNSFYFVPYLYEDLTNYVYNYEVNSSIDRSLEKISYLIIILSMFLTFFSIILIFYFIIRK